MSVFMRAGWSLYPSIIGGLILWTCLYTLAPGRGRTTPWRQQLAFHSGTLVALLALISPLDRLGDEYLFSAHMVQHLLLMFVTAPLWLAGTPAWLVEKLITKKLEGPLKRLLNPISAFFIFVAVMWLWHIPAIYDLALGNEAIHAFEHLSFLAAALIGWWPVAGPDISGAPRPAPPLRMLYVFLLAIPCTGLAAILTFAHTPLYLFYVHAPHIFGLDVLSDQRLGGLLMWLPTHMVLLLALAITFFKWTLKEGNIPGPEHPEETIPSANVATQY